MSARGAVLALLAAVVFGGFGFVQDDEDAWQVEDPDYWLGLIAKYTPSQAENAACNGYLTYAYNAVDEAASHGRLVMDRRPYMSDYRGRVRWEGNTPTHILINPDHSEHVNDYQISMTMAHEGLHWHYGKPIVINGNLMTKDEAETWITKTVIDCYKEEEEEEDDEPTGNPVMPPEPVCEEKTRWVTKTKMVWVPKWEIEWRLEWDEVDEYGNVTHVRIGTRVDNGSWKEVTTLPELETYTECSN